MRTLGWSVLCAVLSVPCWAGSAASVDRALTLYRNEDLNFQIKVPKRWVEMDSNSMVGFRSRKRGPAASFGVLRSAQNKLSIEQVVHRDYKSWSQPKDWQQHLVKVGDWRAMQVDATVSGAAPQKLRMYYIEAQEKLLSDRVPGAGRSMARTGTSLQGDRPKLRDSLKASSSSVP
jgi:hypothetical protein